MLPTQQSKQSHNPSECLCFNRKPIVFTSLAKENEYYDVQNGPNFFFRRTNEDDATTDGVAGFVLRMGYLHQQFGYDRFVLQNPSGNTLVNGANQYPTGAPQSILVLHIEHMDWSRLSKYICVW